MYDFKKQSYQEFPRNNQAEIIVICHLSSTPVIAKESRRLGRDDCGNLVRIGERDRHAEFILSGAKVLAMTGKGFS